MISVPYEVKKALRDGMLRKNYRFLVLNDDGTTDFTIDNDTLVSESVNIDERMCSGDTLKFGLCEGSSLEFQYFNHPNIYGRRIQVFVDVEYSKGPYENVGTLSSDGSDYRYDVSVAGDYRIYIEPSEVENVRATGSVSVAGDDDTNYYDMVVMPDGHGEVLLPGCTTTDKIYLNAVFGKEAHSIVQRKPIPYSIPMGFFDVKKCSRQASTGIMKVTAYNKLMSEYLDANAEILINNISDDGASEGQVTVNTVIAGLLSDYKIEDEVHGIEYEPTASVSYLEVPNVKIKNKSGTYRLILSCAGSSAELDNGYNKKIIEIRGANEYCQYVISCIDSLHQWILDTFQSADALWDSILPIFQTMLMPVIYEPSYLNYTYCAYFPSKYNTTSTVSSGGITYQLRALEGLYRLNQPTSYTVGDVKSLWQRLFSSAWVVNSSSVIQDESWTFDDLASFDDNIPKFYVVEISADGIGQKEIAKSGLSDVTLRNLQSAVFETQCQFGQLSRTTDLFEGVELNQDGLYPSDTLYPADDLYPSGASLSATKAMYSQLWADEGNRRKWRYLIITYKGLDEEDNEADFTLQRTVNADGTDDYNMSDNWLFRNLVWTAEQVGDYADAMVTKMQNNEWFPFEMWCAGLPYLETGDQIEIPLNGEVYKSYILQRQLKGIQNLQDTYINGTLDIFN